MKNGIDRLVVTRLAAPSSLDIGNENCVIAVVKQRGIDVLLNDESRRETPAVVSFGENQRFLGAVRAASATMNLKSTISQVKRLIGRKFKDPGVQDDLRLFPFQTFEGPDAYFRLRDWDTILLRRFTEALIFARSRNSRAEATEIDA
ncbi:hypothetical protein U1Q18_006750 [Sarracenia purpurea var. burkii]